MPVWQRQILTPPDLKKLCRNGAGRVTICPEAITAREIDFEFLRAILLGRIATLVNTLRTIMPDYTYVFGDSWDPDIGWVNFLSRLQVEMVLDYSPFTDLSDLISPIGGLYNIFPPHIVVLDPNDNIIPSWNEVPWLWIRLPAGTTGPTITLYAVVDPLLYDPAQDRPENVFTAPSGWIDTFETWTGWYQRGNGICRQVCDGAKEGLCFLSKETWCDPNGCAKALGFTFDRTVDAIIMEAWVLRPNAGSDCPWDQILFVDVNGNGYNIAVNMFTGELRIYRRDAWAGALVASGTLSVAKLNAWYFARLALFPDGTVIVEVWDEELNRLGVVQGTDTTYNSLDRLAVLGGRPYRVDALRVRYLPYQAGVYQLEPVVTLSEAQVYVYPIEIGEVIQQFTATIDADEVLGAEYSLDGGVTWNPFTLETVVDVAAAQATSIALRFTVRGEVRAWAMLVKTLP